MTQEKYSQLVDEALMHRYRYYVLHSPIITDREYDLLELTIQKIEDTGDVDVLAYSPTQTIGADMPKGYPDHIRDFFQKNRK